MKKIIFFLGCFVSLNAVAQVAEKESQLKNKVADTIPDGWRTGGVIGATFSQVSLNNWAAGGLSSISLNSMTSFFAHYKKGKNTWDNYLDLGYGIVKQGDGDFIKSDDKIEFTSKYGRKASKNWYYAGLANFRSQFAPGYNFPNDSVLISDFMAPGYFLGALGMDYKRGNKLTLFISPLTAKLTVVNNQTLADQGAFGVDAAEYQFPNDSIKTKDGSTTRLEYGGYLRAMYTTPVVKNVTFTTNLNLFSNYAEDPDHIDVNWDNLLSMKVNDFITASVSTSLIYDHDIDIQELNDDGSQKLEDGEPIIGPRTQFKYVIAVGFQYQFGVKDNRE
ncbi:MAG: DUF3078 domain-containing protein [Vicingaceae bacterium]